MGSFLWKRQMESSSEWSPTGTSLLRLELGTGCPVTSSRRLYSCAPDDDIHVSLQIMKEGKVPRLPVIAKNGTLAGVISMDGILLRAEPTSLGDSRNCPTARL